MAVIKYSSHKVNSL